MATYLVAGAVGFIAYRVCGMLLEDGHSVVGIDNFCPDYDPVMKEWRLSKLNEFERFEFHLGNISILEQLNEILADRKFDAVINLAARAGVRASVEDPWDFVATNIIGTVNLLEYCRHHDIQKFVIASTSSAYNADAPFPTPETAQSNKPLQPYAASKIGAEAMAYSYHFLYDIDVTVFRYFTVYGPGARPNQAMFRFVQWISEDQPLMLFGNGEQTRGFTHLDDIARGTIAGLKPVGYELINLGGHEVISINDLIKMMEEKIGKKATIIHKAANKADMATNHADVTKAHQLLGWEPQVSLAEGIQTLIDWYNEEREWTSQVKTL
jgi:nucleoside-diphosphate-sugar epimerase